MFLGISGWWEAPLIDEVIHNRTVNLKGGLGHNIPMDRICEFLNAEFKGIFYYIQWRGQGVCSEGL